MPLFLDACALAKRYLPEYGSRRMIDITRRGARWGGLIVSEFIEPEIISALAKYARQHPKRPSNALQLHRGVVDQLRNDLGESEFTVLNVSDGVVRQASDLLRDRPEYEIHAGDAVHLATALEFRAQLDASDPLVFVTADRGLEAAASAEGLATYNPMIQEISALRTIAGPARS